MSTTNLDLNGNVTPHGLILEEAETRLRQYGPNAVWQAEPHLLLAIAKKFWAPVPWMLEATIILELILASVPKLSSSAYCSFLTVPLVLFRRTGRRMHWSCCENGYR